MRYPWAATETSRLSVMQTLCWLSKWTVPPGKTCLTSRPEGRDSPSLVWVPTRRAGCVATRLSVLDGGSLRNPDLARACCLCIAEALVVRVIPAFYPMESVPGPRRIALGAWATATNLLRLMAQKAAVTQRRWKSSPRGPGPQGTFNLAGVGSSQPGDRRDRVSDHTRGSPANPETANSSTTKGPKKRACQ